MPLVSRTELDLPLLNRGKVRDIYRHDDGILLVATDRLSAFDVVFREPIPHKGQVLTELSAFWAKTLTAALPYHLKTTDVNAIRGLSPQARATLAGRTMLVETLTMMPVECVVRGYLVGSGWKDYQKTGTLCGHALPKGMQNGDRLPRPLFTPSTKAEQGTHDENISIDQAVALVGKPLAAELEEWSLRLFTEASAYAQARGLVLVDTKFEFGTRPDGTLVLADEILTPDSSRYWDQADVERTSRGDTPPSFDKQLVRNYLETLDWNKAPPPPALPAEIIAKTSARYLELYQRLTGRALRTEP